MIKLEAPVSMRALAERARDAGVALRSCTPEQKTRAIQAMARGLLQNADRILAANAQDIEAARAGGMGSAKVDRLTLTEARLRDMAAGLETVATLPDRPTPAYDAPAHGDLVPRGDQRAVIINRRLGANPADDPYRFHGVILAQATIK